MSETRSNILHQIGRSSDTFMEVCASKGKSGRDDPLGLGRIHMFPKFWPERISSEQGLWGHIQTQEPQGPFGKTVHHSFLDGLQLSCTMNEEGVPSIRSVWPSETGGEMGEGRTQRGENVYVSAGVKEGK
jgi:hypothetical protein